MKSIQEGAPQYDFVEVMACPDGYISRGGQPRSPDKEITLKRHWQAMYMIEERLTLRGANEFVQQLYQMLLDSPGGHKAHDLLHTHQAALSRH